MVQREAFPPQQDEQAPRAEPAAFAGQVAQTSPHNRIPDGKVTSEMAWHLMPPTVALEESVAGSGLERSLSDLVKTRASQINGCASCPHLHIRDARPRQAVGAAPPARRMRGLPPYNIRK